MLALVLGAACKEDPVPRGPRGLPPPVADEAGASPSDRDAVDRDVLDDDPGPGPAVPQSIACPSGTESRGAMPPAGTEAYCLRRTDTGGERHGPYRQWYPDGTLRADGSYTAGERDGIWTEHDESGVLRSETTWRNDVRDGRWRTWHDNGKIAGDGSYRDGKKHGLATFWYPDGTKQAQGQWADDVKEGASINWHPDGRVASQGSYVRGNKHGEWVDTQADGTSITSQWNDGVQVQ